MQVQTSHMYCRQCNQSQTNEFMIVVPSAIKIYNTSSRNDKRTFCNFLNVFIVHKNSENPTICFPSYVFPFIVRINFLLLLCLNALLLQQWSNSSGADSQVGYFPTHRTIVIIHRPERPDYRLTVGCFRMDLERLLMLSGWKCNGIAWSQYCSQKQAKPHVRLNFFSQYTDSCSRLWVRSVYWIRLLIASHTCWAISELININENYQASNE